MLATRTRSVRDMRSARRCRAQRASRGLPSVSRFFAPPSECASSTSISVMRRFSTFSRSAMISGVPGASRIVTNVADLAGGRIGDVEPVGALARHRIPEAVAQRQPLTVLGELDVRRHRQPLRILRHQRVEILVDEADQARAITRRRRRAARRRAMEWQARRGRTAVASWRAAYICDIQIAIGASRAYRVRTAGHAFSFRISGRTSSLESRSSRSPPASGPA